MVLLGSSYYEFLRMLRRLDERFHRFSSFLTARAALLARQMKPHTKIKISSACPAMVRIFIIIGKNKSLEVANTGS
jgi:hypothetical protein